MSSIKIEYTNAEGDFFEVNMEAEEVYETNYDGTVHYSPTRNRDIITEAVAAIKRAAGQKGLNQVTPHQG